MSATLGHIRRDADMAGQISYTVTVDYGHDEPPETVTLVGSVYGGPVVMMHPVFGQVFVSEPERFGTFCTDWVRNFYA